MVTGQQELNTVGAVIAAAATEIGIHEHAQGAVATPLAGKLIRAGAAFEQMYAIAQLARLALRPGGMQDEHLVKSLRAALATAEPTLVAEHYWRMAEQASAQQAAA